MLLICIYCHWCDTSFLICQSCYRGHVYCSDVCRRAGRRKSLNEAQRLYRKTKKGKKSHCESENRRRYGKNQPQPKKMDDHTTRRAEIMPSIGVCESLSIGKCHFCGQKGVIVEAFPWRDYS